MKTDTAVTDDLQTSAQLLAHLSGQYQVDVQTLKVMGMKWLARHVKKWYGNSECQLRIFIDRLIYFGVAPSYDAGHVVGGDATVDAVLARAETNVYAALEQFQEFRKKAWEAAADYTPDIYEHAINELEKQAIKIERERALIKRLGEVNYIGARLEDN